MPRHIATTGHRTVPYKTGPSKDNRWTSWCFSVYDATGITKYPCHVRVCACILKRMYETIGENADIKNGAVVCRPDTRCKNCFVFLNVPQFLVISPWLQFLQVYRVRRFSGEPEIPPEDPLQLSDFPLVRGAYLRPWSPYHRQFLMKKEHDFHISVSSLQCSHQDWGEREREFLSFISVCRFLCF